MNDIDRLRTDLTGRVILPEDPDYDRSRQLFRGEIDKRPGIIVRVADAADVAAAISYARTNGLELAVRSGGHSPAGHSTTDGGLVIDLRDMKSIEIDVDARTCQAETGLSAAEVTTATWDHGLTIGFGDTGTVGIGGITLGGGIGFLVRKFGLTIDHLRAAELVMADGRTLIVDKDHEPDLFWAIRGGGGNFGVATRFTYDLVPMPSFVGGLLILPATAEVIAGFMQAADEAPEELSTIANIMNCPPMPFLPAELVGKVVVLALFGFAGDEAAGGRAIAPFRALADPLADFVKPMPYPELFQPEDGEYRPKALDKCFFMDSVDASMAQTILDRLAASDASLRAVQLRALGGAMARVPNDATAFAHRDKRVMAVAVNFWDGPGDYDKRVTWRDETVAAMDQGVPGTYVGFLSNEGEERLRAAYPGATYDRLAEVKARYDPDNVFRLNQNIPPRGA